MAGFLAAAAMGGTMLPAGEPPEDESTDADDHVNILSPTLGGKQFWADELFFHDWHIQRNIFTGHYRLLDGKDFRHAWGTREQCESRLAEIREERQLPPMTGKAVVVLHGLFRSDNSMKRMCRYLHEQGKFSTFNVTYPSTKGTVGDHARALASILAGLEGIEEISFVAHSLGNLVIRHHVADCLKQPGGAVDPRFKRMVMLGPPNNGAQIAEVLLANGLGKVIAGRSGQQLAREWEDLCDDLSIPPFPFGIIAGGRKKDRGYNPLLTGDNDAVVSVDSARLCGAADFAVLPVLHTTMMDNATVQQYTLRFLEQGYFVSEATRNFIPHEAAS